MRLISWQCFLIFRSGEYSASAITSTATPRDSLRSRNCHLIAAVLCSLLIVLVQNMPITWQSLTSYIRQHHHPHRNWREKTTASKSVTSLKIMSHRTRYECAENRSSLSFSHFTTGTNLSWPTKRMSSFIFDGIDQIWSRRGENMSIILSQIWSVLLNIDNCRHDDRPESDRLCKAKGKGLRGTYRKFKTGQSFILISVSFYINYAASTIAVV